MQNTGFSLFGMVMQNAFMQNAFCRKLRFAGFLFLHVRGVRWFGEQL